MGFPSTPFDVTSVLYHSRQLISFVRTASPTYIFTFLVGLLVAAAFGTYGLILLVAHHPRPETDSEQTYLTVTSSGSPSSPKPLPHAFDPAVSPEVEVSVVVPAYNERDRLPGMLAEAVAFLHSTYGPIPEKPAAGKGWEILVVSDGSTDDTEKVALNWAASHLSLGELHPDQLRVVVLEKNRGKGGAVAHGMRHTRGRYAIFADADGASKFSDLSTLMRSLRGVEKGGYGIAVGSRAHMVTTDAVVKRSFVRNFLMYSFHTLLRTVGVREIKDTQCGFKLLSRAAAKAVFADLRTERWIFDIEILLLAGYKGVPVVEVPINWHEVEGTKVDLVRDSIRMAWDLGVVRIGYIVGVYRVGPGGPGRGF